MKKLIFFLLSLIIILSLFLYLYLKKATPPVYLTISFVGDIIPHKAVKSVRSGRRTDRTKKYLKIFSYVSNYIKHSDIAVANLESPVASQRLRHDHYRAFNTPKDFLTVLKIVGFDVLNIANNHIFDCRFGGFQQTIKNLYDQSFRVTGLTYDRVPLPLIVTNKGIKVGFIGFTRLINWFGATGVKTNLSLFEREESYEHIKKIKKGLDFLIVSMHWGKEYSTNYTELRQVARSLFSAGADFIMGHHPHILLPVEYENSAKGLKNVVAYSLGNFVANMGRDYESLKSWRVEGRPRRSVILTLRIKKQQNRLSLDSFEVVPVWIHNNYQEFYISGKDKERMICPVDLDDCPQTILSKEQQDFEKREIYRSLKLIQKTNR
ncbi:MAG: CapA family protein [Spirochaetes bacterium]|nr:CapA family protein [Spirochaetota bacterium]